MSLQDQFHVVSDTSDELSQGMARESILGEGNGIEGCPTEELHEPLVDYVIRGLILT